MSLIGAYLSTLGLFSHSGSDTDESIMSFGVTCALLATIVWNGSRIAAIGLGLYVLAEVLVALSNTSQYTLLLGGFGVITITWVTRLIIATFAYFRDLKTNELKPAGSEIIRGFGNALVILMAVLAAIGVFILIVGNDGSRPSPSSSEYPIVDSAIADILKSQRDFRIEPLPLPKSASTQRLIEEGILSPDEKPVLSYTPSEWGELASGVLVFSDEVVSWDKDGERIRRQSATLGEICSFRETGYPGRKTITAYGVNDEPLLNFTLLKDDPVASSFLAALKVNNRRRMSGGSYTACVLGNRLDTE